MGQIKIRAIVRKEDEDVVSCHADEIDHSDLEEGERLWADKSTPCLGRRRKNLTPDNDDDDDDNDDTLAIMPQSAFQKERPTSGLSQINATSLTAGSQTNPDAPNRVFSKETTIKLQLTDQVAHVTKTS